MKLFVSEAAMALQNSETGFRRFGDHATDASFVYDEQLTVLDVNPQACESLGYSREELIGMHPRDFDVGLDEASSARLAEQVGAGETAIFESLHRRKDGSVFPVEIRAHPFQQGEQRFHLALVRDISERSHGQAALPDSEHRYRALFERANDAVFLENDRDEIIEVNERACALLGYSREELFTMKVPDLQAPEIRGQAGSVIRGEIEKHGGATFESVDLHRSGRRIPVEVTNTRLAHQGQILVLSIVRDITERKRAEEQHRAHLWFLENMDQINRAMQGSHDLEHLMSDVLEAVLSIFDSDRAWLVHPCDPQAPTWRVAMEHTRAEFPGAFVLGVDLPVDPAVARVFDTVRSSSGAVRFGPGADQPVPAELAERFKIQSMIAMVVPPKLGQPYLFGLHQCSAPRVWAPTEERLFQEIGRRLTDALTSLLIFRSLRDSERRLEEAQRIAHVGYWDRDLDAGRITLSNEGARIFGLQPEERVVDLSVWHERWQTLIHPEDRPRAAAAAAAALAGGPRYDVEYRVVHRTGEERIVHSQGDVIRDASGRPIRMFGIMQDITERKRAEVDLRASEERFRTLVQFSFDVYWETDAEHRFTRQEFAESLADAPAPGAEIGKTRWEVPYLEPDEAAWQKHRATLDAHLPFRDFELARPAPDGGKRYVSVSGLPVFDETGRFLGYRGVGRHITDRKRAEQALRESQAYLAEAQRLSHTGSWAFDVARNKYVYVSEECLRIFELDAQEDSRTREAVSRLIHPEDWPRVNEAFEKTIREKVDTLSEFRITLLSGTVKHIQAIRHPVLNDAGDVFRLVGTVIDITERKRAEEELRQSAERFRAIADYTYDWEYWVGVDGRLLWVNPAVERITGYSVGECLVMPDFPISIVAEADRETVGRQIREAVQGSTRNDFEFRVRHKDGRPVWVAASWQPIYDSRGARLGHRSSIRDIAERKQAEGALRQSEVYLAEAQRLSHTGSWAFDVAGNKYVYVSEECLRIFELDAQEDSRTREAVSRLIHPEDWPRVNEAFEKSVREKVETSSEFRIRLPGGTVKHVHVIRHPVPNDAGDVGKLVGTVVDVTERKLTEQRLLAQHTVTRILAEAASVEEATPRILQAVCECLGWDLGALWRIDREAGVLRCAELWRRPSIEVAQFEAVTRGSTFGPGSGLPGRVWVSRAPACIPDVARDPNFLRGGVAAREALHAAFAFPILLDSEVLGVIDFVSREIRQPHQDLLDMMATIGSQIGQFIERKRAENALQHVQAELAHVTRVMTMGELTASIAHEINQPLGAIVNSASAGVRWLAAQKLDEARRSLARVIAEGHRASEIIGRIRAMVRKMPPRKERLDMNEAIQEVIALVRGEVRRNRVSLQTRLDSDLPHILGDRIQLEQVLLNLIKNAIEAMTGEDLRELWVSSERIEPTEVRIAVRDSGPGLDPASLDRVFESFYTTKPHGLGVGLAISRSIIEAHGGRLWATPNDPRGATFQFTLPTAGGEGS